jgi:hypothetical protein
VITRRDRHEPTTMITASVIGRASRTVHLTRYMDLLYRARGPFRSKLGCARHRETDRLDMRRHEDGSTYSERNQVPCYLAKSQNGIRSTDRRFGQTCVSSRNSKKRGGSARACKATGSLARYPPPPCGLFVLTTARDQVRPGRPVTATRSATPGDQVE